MSNQPSVPPRPDSGLSRRGLLLLAALAAAGVPVGLSRGAALASGNDDYAYQLAFAQMLTNDQNVRVHSDPDGGFLYRPGQLLVAPQDVVRVRQWLSQNGFTFVVDQGFGDCVRFRLDPTAQIPAIVTQLRYPGAWPNQPPPLVQPHHVLVGFGNIMGNPGSPPAVAAPLPQPDPARSKDGVKALVGICDTGIWTAAGNFHRSWLGGCYQPEVDDEDRLYAHDDVLALQGGHGTFVAGVVRQAAPGTSLDPEVALNPDGVGDEEMVVRALAALDRHVSIVNLSLGCFTQDDRPSMPLANALRRLPSGTAVVAAAGNAGVKRPSWPAALDGVIAVAATGTDGEPAEYSNFGSWVDAHALGEWDSTHVKGRLKLPECEERHFEGYARWAGTSFATGYVSGRLAVVMTERGLSGAQAWDQLRGEGRWLPDYGVLVE